MRIESRRFGCIELEEKDLLHFAGLPGFPQARRFALLGHDRGQAFAWLLCADHPELAFAVTDPWQFFPEYEPAIELRHLRPLGVGSAEELEVLAIATLGGGKIRVNLAAPLLIHVPSRRGAQVILDGSRWSTRQEVKDPMPLAVGTAAAPTKPAEAPATPAPGGPPGAPR